MILQEDNDNLKGGLLLETMGIGKVSRPSVYFYR